MPQIQMSMLLKQYEPVAMLKKNYIIIIIIIITYIIVI